jgi:hypothetical protein
MDKLFSFATLIFLLVAFVGIVAHAVKKWAQGEINGGVIDWFVMNPKLSVGIVMAASGGVIAAVFAGELTDYHSGVQFGAAFLLGFSADTFNNQKVARDGQ